MSLDIFDGELLRGAWWTVLYTLLGVLGTDELRGRVRGGLGVIGSSLW